MLLAVGFESSKVAFYVCAGAFALWAVILSAIGLRSADFPGNSVISRVAIAISFGLMVATMAAAVATS